MNYGLTMAKSCLFRKCKHVDGVLSLTRIHNWCVRYWLIMKCFFSILIHDESSLNGMFGVMILLKFNVS